MDRYAMVKNNVVENIAIWDGTTPWSPDGYTIVRIGTGVMVDIGWGYEGGQFVEPEGEE
jgi:hypothetical protein